MLRQASIRSKATGSLRSSLQRYSHSVCSLQLAPSPPEMIEMNLFTISRLASIFNIKFDKTITLYNFQMLGLNFPDLSAMRFSAHIEKTVVVDDPLVLPHLADMLALIDQNKTQGDIVHVSNLVKQTRPKPEMAKKSPTIERPIPEFESIPNAGIKDYVIKKYSLEAQKLQWVGAGLTKQEISIIQIQLVTLAETKKVKQIRFWGKVLGIDFDYYVIQGVTGEVASLEEVVKGGEKRGEGINFFTFWVTNNLYEGQWTELPQITPAQLKASRKVKKFFSGYLDKPLFSFPQFQGVQKHYLKTQLVRMTNSLELVPKGIYKPNDENSKVIQYQQEFKIPEFAELSAAQSWVHRNQNILHLGRCTHYIDPSTPEDQLEAVTAELAEKDPELERLRSITEDKLPEGSPLGVENIWQVKVVGDNQIFQKDEAANVYGVVVLKNIYWPGWTTIGYKGGFSNHYVGFGLKSIQPTWSSYENANLNEQFEDPTEFHEPNPKEQPKPPAEPAPEEPQPQE